MPSRYDPQNHIQRLHVAPRAEGILDQREVTIHSYQTTVPFDFDALDSGLAGAWLTPQIRFGVFSRVELEGTEALGVVLGLQDDLAVRAYDYDERRPLWFSWQNVIVDTVNIHYFRDEDGLLRFTTTGGGPRITDERLHEFNSAFVGIPKESVTKRHFDIDKLRDLCFGRFAENLYMVRFSEPSGKEYHSIDHALFQSRQYIDPDAERMVEIRRDTKVKIESFDSDVIVKSDIVASPIQVRFFLRGLSGALRLRFPKITYKKQIKTVEEQALLFYRLADSAVGAILDADYYSHQSRSLYDLGTDLGMFPDMVDLAPYRDVLTSSEQRRKFIGNVDLGERWEKWLPHLRALDELLASDVIAKDFGGTCAELVGRDHCMAQRLLATCQKDPKLRRVGTLLAGALAAALQSIPAETRAQVEEAILSWAIEQESETWDVDADTGEFTALALTWRIEDIAFDILPVVLWKLVGVLHARLTASTGDVGPLLAKFRWNIAVAESLPAHHSRSPAALRLVAAGHLPKSVSEGDRILKQPVADLRALDEAVLAQFGLPLWPRLTASRSDHGLEISNDGIGAAYDIRLSSSTPASDGDGAPAAFDLDPGKSAVLALADSGKTIGLQFEKLEKTYRVVVPVVDVGTTSTVGMDGVRSIPAVINRKRVEAQRVCRAEIDPDGIVVGSSPALLEVFEHIHHANLMGDLPPVLLLGEPGVGKTHVARLLHNSSKRSAKTFKVVNAGGGGGDINIQRGEWIGYGKGHGIQGIDKQGRPGHLMNSEGGTLFIDEFAALSPDLQVIFLSVLEKRSIESIGGESITPDVRCIFATNADVEEEIASGKIRRDLVDRIPMRIQIPPLRIRRGDILLLARHFASSHRFVGRALIALLHYDWPGNVRELQSKIGIAAARMKGEGRKKIGLTHLDLPVAVVSEVEALENDACSRELWILADGIARDEGFQPGVGLQRRAGEIMGVSGPQASKMYQEFGLARAASA